MQDVDGPAHVQALPQPARGRGPCVQAKSLCIMSCAEVMHGIVGHHRRRRDLGQESAVRATESKLAVGLSRDLIALLVDRPVMPATEQGEIRQRGGSTLGPVTDVMALTDPHPAAWEAAAAVAVVERPP